MSGGGHRRKPRAICTIQAHLGRAMRTPGRGLRRWSLNMNTSFLLRRETGQGQSSSTFASQVSDSLFSTHEDTCLAKMESLYHSNSKKDNSNWFTIVLSPDSAEGRAVSLFVEFGDGDFHVPCLAIRWPFGLFCLEWPPVYQRQNPEIWTRTAGRCDVTVALSCRRRGSH